MNAVEAVGYGIGQPVKDSWTAVDSALEWLGTLSSRPLLGFSDTKEVSPITFHAGLRVFRSPPTRDDCRYGGVLCSPRRFSLAMRNDGWIV